MASFAIGLKCSITTLPNAKCDPPSSPRIDLRCCSAPLRWRRKQHFTPSAAANRLSKGKNQVMVAWFYATKNPPRHPTTITIASKADSGQTFPSQDKDEERGVGCSKERVLPREPSPQIEPAEVVQAQLQALCNKDIETVFEFASPKNKAHTGPLSRFTELIQGRAYNIMLGHSSAEILSSLSIAPGRFQQRVRIEGPDGNVSVFSWSLTRQEEDPFKGCWMTDSVHRDQ